MSAPSPSPRPAQPELLEFDALYRREFAYVWRMLRAHGVPEARIEDAVQDVFMVVYRRWADWQADSRALAPRSWLFGIARRVAANHRRRQARESRPPDLALVAEAEAPADERTARRRALAQLERALDELDERSRTVFVLAELEGMTGPEIAELVGEKLNTVYWRLRTARAKVTKKLQARGGQP